MSLSSSATTIAFVLTRDRPTSDAFYRDTLGLTFLKDDGFAAVFDLRPLCGSPTYRTTPPRPIRSWAGRWPISPARSRTCPPKG